MKDWTGNRKSTFATLGASSHSNHEREQHDYYATEPKAIDKLFNALNDRNFHHVWECACGEGHLSKRIKAISPGTQIRNSDIVKRGFDCDIIDFLKSNPHPYPIHWHIITNPPYKYAQAFVEKAINIISDGYLACFFLKLTFLEGQKRRELFAKYPPWKVLVSSARLKCAMNGDFDNTGSSAAAYAWFVWEKGYCGKTTIEWI